MYVMPNFKSKKMFKEAVAAGTRVEVFSTGPFPAATDGIESVEGPHFPAAHTWYARVQVANGVVVRVIA